MFKYLIGERIVGEACVFGYLGWIGPRRKGEKKKERKSLLRKICRGSIRETFLYRSIYVSSNFIVRGGRGGGGRGEGVYSSRFSLFRNSLSNRSFQTYVSLPSTSLGFTTARNKADKYLIRNLGRVCNSYYYGFAGAPRRDMKICSFARRFELSPTQILVFVMPIYLLVIHRSVDYVSSEWDVSQIKAIFFRQTLSRGSNI